MMRTVLILAGCVFALLLQLSLIGFIVGPQPAKAPRSSPAKPDAQPGNGFDLHGLARAPMPKAFRFIGLDSYNGQLRPAEQLARHDDPRGLVFRFDAHARNDWGGHARDPMLLSIVLLNPATSSATPERHFTIGRYYSPTGSTIALDDARWNERSEATAHGMRTWRWLEMNDHFSADHAPRWAVSVYEPARAVRLDLFVWRKLMSLDEARAMLTATLDTLIVHPARAAHFQRAGTHEERMACARNGSLRSLTRWRRLA
jgi:hypothetical protein